MWGKNTEKLIELGELLDWYGLLLTEKQREIMAQYANENCSLSEIAEREGISRQGVRDQINTYMRTVMNEEPIDPSLEILPDDQSW